MVMLLLGKRNVIWGANKMKHPDPEIIRFMESHEYVYKQGRFFKPDDEGLNNINQMFDGIFSDFSDPRKE